MIVRVSRVSEGVLVGHVSVKSGRVVDVVDVE